MIDEVEKDDKGDSSNKVHVPVTQGDGKTNQDADEESISIARAASEKLNSALLADDLERSYLELKESHKVISQTNESQRSQITSLQTLIDELQSKLSERDKQIFLTKENEEKVARKTSLLEETSNDATERVRRIEVEADSLREEISRLSAQNKDLNIQITELNTNASISSASTAPLEYEVKRLRSELDTLQTHASWLEDEVSNKSSQIIELKLSNSTTLKNLNTELDRAKAERDESQFEVSSLKLRNGNLQTKLDSAVKTILEKDQNHADIIHELQTEIHTERRLVDLHKENTARVEDRYNDAVREIETLKRLASASIEEHKLELENVKNEMENKLQESLDDLDKKNNDTIENLKEDLNRLMAEKVRIENNLNAKSRKATHLVIRDDEESSEERLPIMYEGISDGGKLMSLESYEKLADLEDKLKREKLERQRLEMYFERIQKDIESKAPELRQQRKEYELAMAQRHEMHEKLRNALEESNLAKSNVITLEKESQEFEKECGELRLENTDLAHQVQSLLKKLMSNAFAEEQQNDDLIGFGSIEDLQRQNQRLLREYHRLMAQVKELEGKLDTDEVQIKLRDAEDERLQLTEERENQATLVASIIQQRDLYRALLMKHDSEILVSSSGDGKIIAAKTQIEKYTEVEGRNKELVDTIAKLNAELSSALNAKEGLEEKVKRLDTYSNDLSISMEKLQTDLLSAQAATARSNAELSFHQQRSQHVEEKVENLQKDVARLDNCKKDLYRINEDLQSSLLSAKNDSFMSKQKVEQTEHKLRLAETQVETIRLSEKRLATEVSSLKIELAKQGTLLDSIQKIETSLSARTSGEQERLREEVERLSNLLSSKKESHLNQIEEIQNRVFELERKKEEIENSRELLLAEKITAKEDAVQAKSQVQELSKKVGDLETMLETANLRLKDAELGTQEDKIVEMRSELLSLKNSLESANKKAENYKTMAKASDKALAEASNSSKECSSKMEGEIEKLKSELKSYQNTARVKQEALDEISSDLISINEKNAKEVHALKLKLEQKINELEISTNKCTQLQIEVEKLSSDINTYKADAIASRDNYERELSLHASTAKSLHDLRNVSAKENELRVEAEAKLSTMSAEIDSERDSWSERKGELEVLANDADKRVKELQNQNKILLNQISNLSISLDKSQAEKLSSVSNNLDENIGESKDDIHEVKRQLSEMREVVRFLNSERSLFDSQLVSARRTTERERAALEVTKRSLDETRAELKLLQNQNDNSTQEESKIANMDELDNLKMKLKETDSQLILLKESNQLLREDANRLEHELSLSKKELGENMEKLEPSEKKCQELDVKMSAFIAEKASLEREILSWKERVQSLVRKFNQIDPEEHSKALAQIESVQKECASLLASKEKAEAENTSAKALIVKLNEDISQQKDAIDSVKKLLEKEKIEKEELTKSKAAADSLTKENDELKASKSSLEVKVKASKSDAENSKRRLDNLMELLRKNKTKHTELKNKYDLAVTKEQELKSALSKEQESNKELIKKQEESIALLKVKEEALQMAQKVSNSAQKQLSKNIKEPQKEPEKETEESESDESSKKSLTKGDMKNMDKSVASKMSKETISIPNNSEDPKDSNINSTKDDTKSSSNSLNTKTSVAATSSEKKVKEKQLKPMAKQLDKSNNTGDKAMKEINSTIKKTKKSQLDGSLPNKDKVPISKEATEQNCAKLTNTTIPETSNTKEIIASKPIVPISKESALREKLMKRKRALEAVIATEKNTPTTTAKTSVASGALSLNEPSGKKLKAGIQGKLAPGKDSEATAVTTPSLPATTASKESMESSKDDDKHGGKPADVSNQEFSITIDVNDESKEIGNEKKKLKTHVSEEHFADSPCEKSDSSKIATKVVTIANQGENKSVVNEAKQVEETSIATFLSTSKNLSNPSSSPFAFGTSMSTTKTLNPLAQPFALAQTKDKVDESSKQPSIFGSGTFLNLQPPGSGQSKPLVFGSSAKIQLPTPSKKLPITQLSFEGLKPGQNPFDGVTKSSPSLFDTSFNKKHSSPTEDVNDKPSKLARTVPSDDVVVKQEPEDSTS